MVNIHVLKKIKRDYLHEGGKELYDKGYTTVFALSNDEYQEMKSTFSKDHKVTIQDGDLPGFGCYVYIKDQK